MSSPADQNLLRKLESEAHECERAGDFLGALDIFEEIVRKGWADAKHLTALGYCYVKNRQRQNAKEIWLRALAQDADCKLCREALDKYFPGWEDQEPAQRLMRREEMPPPPPPPPPPPSFGAGAELTVETTSAASIKPRETFSNEPVAAAPSPEPRVPAQTQANRTAAAHQAAQRKDRTTTERTTVSTPVQTDEAFEGRVCWDYVLGDAAEEAAYARR